MGSKFKRVFGALLFFIGSLGLTNFTFYTVLLETPTQFAEYLGASLIPLLFLLAGAQLMCGGCKEAVSATAVMYIVFLLIALLAIKLSVPQNVALYTGLAVFFIGIIAIGIGLAKKS